MTYNVFAKRVFKGVKVSVNLSFTSVEDIEVSSTGVFENLLLNSIQ